MKLIARIVFKLHKKIYKYPCRSEVRLGIEQYFMNGGLTWYVGILYICKESLSDISQWVGIPKDEVIYHLNKIARGVVL